MSSDITSKRLISLAPEEWVRWASQVADVGECEIIGSEFQFVSRNTDTLIHVKESALGEFLTLFEFQTHYTPKMPRRMRAYAGLAEEKFEVPVLPILINILPYTLPIPHFYES